jgi:hypothetical protein
MAVPETEASEDAFGDAFSEFVEGGEEPTGDESADEPEGDDPENKDDAPEGDEPEGSEVTDVPEGDEPEGDTEGEDPEDNEGESAVKTAEEIQAELAALNHKYSTLQGMYNSEVRKKRDAEPDGGEDTDGGEDADGDGGPKPTDTDEEAASFELEGLAELPAFKELNEELGVAATSALADGLSHVAKSVVEQVTKAFETRMSGIEGRIQPISEEYAQSATEKHFAMVSEKHPDRAEIIESGDIQAWMENQPEYKKKMYTEVFEKGSADEVIDLFDTYKAAVGKVAPAARQDKAVEKSVKKDEDLEALETVDTRSAPLSTGRGKPSKDDFSGAWAEANKP